MSTVTLGSGLEMFEYVMDTEAEATVSIKSGDDADTTAMEPAAAETIAEDNVATEEQADESVETAADNVEQTEKAMAYAFSEFETAYNIYKISKRYGASAGFLDYLNKTTNFSAKSSMVRREVPSVEAYNGSDTHRGMVVSAAEGMLQNAWQAVKNFFIKLKEFFIQLGKTIYSKFVGQKKRLDQLKKDIATANNVTKFPDAIAEVQVVSVDNLKSAIATLDKYVDTINTDTPESVDKLKPVEDLLSKKVNFSAANIHNKGDVSSLIDTALKLVGSGNDFEKKIKDAVSEVDKILSNLNKNADGADKEAITKDREKMTNRRKAMLRIIKLTNQAINSVIYVGNLYMRGASLYDKDVKSKAAGEDLVLDAKIDRLNIALEQFNKFEIGTEGFASDAIEAIRKFFRRIKEFFVNMWDRFTKWLYEKFAKIERISRALDKVKTTKVNYGDNKTEVVPASNFKNVTDWSSKLVTEFSSEIKDVWSVKDRLMDMAKYASDYKGKTNDRTFLDAADKTTTTSGEFDNTSEAVSGPNSLYSKIKGLLSSKRVAISSVADYTEKSAVSKIVAWVREFRKNLPKFESYKKEVKTALDEVEKIASMTKPEEKAKLKALNWSKRRMSLIMSKCSNMASLCSKVIKEAVVIASEFVSAAEKADSEASK